MEITLYDELKLIYPDIFRIMKEEALKKLDYAYGSPELTLYDEEDHALLTVGHKKINFIVSKLLSAKDIAKKSELVIKKAMEGFEYRFDKFETRDFGDKKADGFRFEYKADNIDMIAHMYVVKIKTNLFYIYFYGRKESEEMNGVLLDRIRLK